MLRYLDWHYFTIWTRLLVLWRNITLFPFYYFSIPLHLRTLFLPWKRQVLSKKPGFHPTDILYVLSFNILSRIIAAIVRLLVIISGLSLMLPLFILAGIPAVIWVAIPVVTLPLYLSRTGEKKDEVKEILAKSKNDPRLVLLNLCQHKEGQFILRRLGLNEQSLMTQLMSIQKGRPEPAKNYNFQACSKISDLTKVLANSFTPFKTILEQSRIKIEDIEACALWHEKQQRLKKPPLMYDLNRIKSLPGIGFEWAYGYTVNFDRFSFDLTKKYSVFPLLLGREKEIREIERILSKTQNNNVVIAGEPGTARHIILETLAHRLISGKCPQVLSHKRILSLNMQLVLSQAPSLTQAKGILENILYEAILAGNIITFIDELDKYCATSEGRTDIADVIAKFAVSSVGFIGITTPAAYHKYIATNPVLSPLFEKVEVTEPGLETVVTELELSIVPVLEDKYDLTITYQAIRKTLEESGRYISARPYPGKAIDLLDESCLFCKTARNGEFLLPVHIDQFLSQKLHIPLGEIEISEKEKLENLESRLHRRIVDQEPAIRVLASALRRRRLAVSSDKKPIGSFLFLGPTGVGKTETAKALAEVYFGSEEKMARFDMSQYQGEEGFGRLIGSIKLGNPGELTSKLKDDPFSLLLFDEFEKSVPEIFNLFLTLFDEGYITESTGKKIDAKNAIIIATSNAGAEFIRESINIGAKNEDLQKSLVEYILSSGIFSPELINRFDGVVVFSPLSEGNLREVAKKELAVLNKRLAEKEISVAITAELVRKLAIVGYDRQFGGRAIKRVIAEKIEDQIAQKLLAGTLKKGEAVEIQL